MSPQTKVIAQASLAAAVEQATDCVVITDTAGNIQYVNPAYTALTGYSIEEAVGQHTRIHKSGMHSTIFYTELWDTIVSGRVWQGEVTNRRKDGTFYQEEMRITPVLGLNNEVVSYIAIKHDVTKRREAEQALGLSLELAQSTIDALSSHICVLNETATIIAVNKAWREFAKANRKADLDNAIADTQGRSLGEGANYLAVCECATGAEAKEATEFAAAIRAALNGECELYSAEYSCHSPSQKRWFLGRVRRFMSNSLPRILIEHINITERRMAEETLLFKTALLEGQTETTIDGILAVDESNNIVLANGQFGRIFEIPPDLLSAGDDLVVRTHVAGMVSNPDAFGERIRYLYLHPDQKSTDEIRLRNGKTLDRYSAPLLDSTAQYRGRIWYFRDITARKAAEDRSQFLAYHDALTGLPHRVLLRDRLDNALSNARRRDEKVALLFLDLDRFKSINDTFGHLYGDAVLTEVARRLKGLAREQDTVARLSGDEFLIMLTCVKDVASAAGVAERMLEAIEANFIIQGQSISVGCSIGISVFPEHGAEGETLIKNADAAMYSAKQGGRGNVRLFADRMNDEAAARMMMDKDLRLALARKEFALVYQPQMEMRSGRIIGLEALIRWHHPEMGVVPPDKFISIAENSGLIVGIGEWVLRTACKQARKWQDDGLAPVPVAVNVSAVQFRQEGFLALIRRVLRETGLSPQYLELELTEGVLLSNAEFTLSVLRELNQMEVKLAIDDFGVGFSSLSYLKNFPVSKLKIDRSFISGLGVDSKDASIVIAIISMAKSLNLKVIAEGVETEEQMSFLRQHQCDEIQGYYLSRPIAADEVAGKIRRLSASTQKLSVSPANSSPVQCSIN